MNIGILGSGNMGATHARAFAKLPDVHVAAISSRTLAKAEALAKEVGARATTDDMAIIDDPSVEVISNTLPTPLHPKFTIAALKAGKPVLLEKPFGLIVGDCDEIMAVARQSPAIFMIAHVLRFWPEYVALVDFVKSGALGRPLSAVAARLSVAPTWASWFREPELSGGAVLDLSVHDFDALNWVLGQPKSVYARGHEASPNLWNHMLAIVDYGASQGSVEGSQFMPKDYPFTATFKVLCENGVVEYVSRAGGTRVDMPGNTSLTVYEVGRSYGLEAKHEDGYEAQAAYFIDCVRNKRQPMLGTPVQARLAVQLSNAARQSMETGKIVSL